MARVTFSHVPSLTETGRQLNTLVDGLNILAAQVELGAYDVQYRAPLRPRAGMVIYADGVTWDPGSGEGLYVFKRDNAWHFLG